MFVIAHIFKNVLYDYQRCVIEQDMTPSSKSLLFSRKRDKEAEVSNFMVLGMYNREHLA